MRITVTEHLGVALFTIAVLIIIKFGLRKSQNLSHYAEDL